MNCVEEQLEDLKRLVHSHPDDASHHLNLGRLLWEKEKEKEKAAECFLMAAKLNPQEGEAFRYLGDYYRMDVTQSQRAIKCYQRAVSLNPLDSLSGISLCDLLDSQGIESLQIAVCRDASAKSPRAFWAFSRLGFLLLHQHKWSEAVQCLQYAIRGYPSSAPLWEALGLAYQRLGMYTAAIKSYGRAMELDGSRVFSMIETGNIHLMLGSYREGIEQFQRALEICPRSACAQYGLASGLLALSQDCIKQGAFSWAMSLLQEAIETGKICTILASNMPCVWKLHADIQLTYAKSLPWTEACNVKDEEAFSRSLGSWKKTRHIASVSAKRSYQRALHLAPWKANIYMDVAVAVDLSSSLQEIREDNLFSWKLAEKMLLGSLLLEGDNKEFWMALGCMSDHGALRQHAFVRGLHLDVSLASAWAYLGKLYKEEGENQLGRQSFDRARSIDPTLALPWAGMSADILMREPASDEAFDSCLRAVQILPLAEFQIGVAKLALLSNHLLSSEVFGAIRQALQCAPWYPETHNLNGLVSEARHDYESAVTYFRLARYAWKNAALPHSHWSDISVNLARTLCKAGHVHDALQELEDLKERGLLDIDGLQVYCVSMWKSGKNDMALSAVRDLATCFPTMKLSSAEACVCLVCSLLYSISGADSAINTILKLPRELLLSPKLCFLISALHSLHQTHQLHSVLSSSRTSLSFQEDIVEMHLLIALNKLINTGCGHSLSMQSGIHHLKKALHMYPNATSLRNMLGYLILSHKQGEKEHVVRRCCAVVPLELVKQNFRSSHEIICAEAIACHATTSCKTNFSFSTCNYQSVQATSVMALMQRWVRLEPWNHNARYLLVLNLLQRARRARYPQHLMNVLKRITYQALTCQIVLVNTFERYKRFQLLLCSSELSLLGGDTSSCVSIAGDASNLMLPDVYTYFAHLQLCRAHALAGSHTSLNEEIAQCLKLKTSYPFGWISLKIIESLCRARSGSSFTDLGFRDIIKEINKSDNSWLAIYSLFCGLICQSAQQFLHAEEFLANACSLKPSDTCIFLCHGAVCMELAKKQCGYEYLTKGLRSLKKAQEKVTSQLPFVSLLIAQAEASLGSKTMWDRILQVEWYAWSPETRPAEIYFQMHLLTRGSQDSLNWVLRAIHLNPSSLRYWKILCKITD